LLRHAEVVTIREVIRDLAVADAIPVDVMNLEAPTRRLCTHKQSAVDRSLGDAFVRPTHAAARDDHVAFGDQVEDLHLPVGKGPDEGTSVAVILASCASHPGVSTTAQCGSRGAAAALVGAVARAISS
jgi:hypothetical protein